MFKKSGLSSLREVKALKGGDELGFMDPFKRRPIGLLTDCSIEV